MRSWLLRKNLKSLSLLIKSANHWSLSDKLIIDWVSFFTVSYSGLYEFVALIRLKDQTVLIVDCVECLSSQLITHELNEGDTLLRNMTHLYKAIILRKYLIQLGRLNSPWQLFNKKNLVDAWLGRSASKPWIQLFIHHLSGLSSQLD